MIFDDIISPDYIDHGQSVYIGSPGRGVAGAKNDLKNSLDKLDDFKYVVKALIASPWYPDLVGALMIGRLGWQRKAAQPLAGRAAIEIDRRNAHRREST